MRFQLVVPRLVTIFNFKPNDGFAVLLHSILPLVGNSYKILVKDEIVVVTVARLELALSIKKLHQALILMPL